MGRGPTNENTNMYFQARKKAATYNERLWSREGAAELLGISVSTLADYELGNTKVVPVDKVVLMADLYNAPELITGYCMRECPVHGFLPLATEEKSLEGIALRLLQNFNEDSLKNMGNTKNPTTKSKYTDGLIGWKKLPIRAQETLYRWEYDNEDNLLGMTQMPPPDFGTYTIPMSKALLFRTKSRKNNPEGRSILRNAYRSWYFKRRIQEIEGIGIERDLAGLPVMHAPEGLDIWDDAIDENKRTRIALENMVKSIRRDEMEGVVLPAGYELELLSSGGTRQFDTNAIINRYDTRIAMTVLADFIFLGHSETGSWALSSDKTELFAMAIGAFLDMICETFNSQGIPPLIDINGEHFAGITEYPKMSHGDIADVDVTKVAAFIKDMTGIGILVPDDGLEDYIRQVGHLPERTTDDRTIDQRRKQQAEQNQPPEPETAAGSDENGEGEEIPDNVVEAAKRRLGRSGANGNKVHTAKANTQGKDAGQSRSPTQT